jgi:hypothetical protein
VKRGEKARALSAAIPSASKTTQTLLQTLPLNKAKVGMYFLGTSRADGNKHKEKPKFHLNQRTKCDYAV